MSAESVVGVLGATSIVGPDGQRRAVAGQQGDVLSLLAAGHPSGVRTDVLYEVLWGERLPRTAATGLRVVVNRLRERLAHIEPEPIINEAGHYRLVLDPEQIDHHQFARAATEGRRALERGPEGADEAIRLFEEALGCWRGDAFQSAGDLGPIVGVRTQLDEARADTEERLIEALMLAGRHDDASVRASAAIGDVELRERRWELLILALYRSGRQTEALRAHQRAVRLLAEEYGLEPGPALAELEHRILVHDPALQPVPTRRRVDGASASGADDLRTLVATLRRVPTVPSIPHPLVGRDDDLAKLSLQLKTHRMVTLVGTAGVGKSRLAAQYAQGVTGERVIWLDLTVHRPDTVVDQLAAQLGVGGHAGQVVDAVIRALTGTSTLLVFDNCEHVLDTMAPLVEALVSHCTGLRVLATSRMAFDSPSEIVVAVGPLEADAARHLLLDRLSGVPERADLETERLDELLDSVDRIPLALELVAGRLRSHPLGSVVAELAQSIESLKVARGSQRHAGLADALDWSVQLLAPEIAEVYDTLGVMSGPFRSLELAQILAVPAAGMTERLERLVDSSLLGRTSTGELMTYRSLQTVRTHARSRLSCTGREAELEARHAEVYARLVRWAGDELRGTDEERAVARVAPAVDQIRAAFEWALRHDLAMAESIAVEFWEYAFLRLEFAQAAWPSMVIDALGPSGAPSPDLLATAAFGSWALGFTEQGLAQSLQAERAAAAAGRAVPIRALQARANIASMLGDGDLAEATMITAYDLARRSGDDRTLADLQTAIVIGLVRLGLVDQALGMAEGALEMANRSGNASLIAWARFGHGFALAESDPAAARREVAEGGRLASSVRNRWVSGMATAGLVRAERLLGNTGAAAGALHDVLEQWRVAGMAGMVVHCLREAALVFDAHGATDDARATLGLLAGLSAAPSLIDLDGAAVDALFETHAVDRTDTPSGGHTVTTPGGVTAMASLIDGAVAEVRGRLDALAQVGPLGPRGQ